MSDRYKDALIAIRDHGYSFEKRGGRSILLPPLDDERRFYTSIWDDDGLPHWLPKFSEQTIQNLEQKDE